MEISPIAGIRVMPVAKVPPADHNLSAVFDIESSARSADDTWSGDARKSSGGQDDEFDDPIAFGETDAISAQLDDTSTRRISFFA